MMDSNRFQQSTQMEERVSKTEKVPSNGTRSGSLAYSQRASSTVALSSAVTSGLWSSQVKWASQTDIFVPIIIIIGFSSLPTMEY